MSGPRMSKRQPGYAPHGEYERAVLRQAARAGGVHPRMFLGTSTHPQMAAALWRLVEARIIADEGVRFRCVEILPGRYLPPPPDQEPPYPLCEVPGCTDEVFHAPFLGWTHRWADHGHPARPRTGPSRYGTIT